MLYFKFPFYYIFATVKNSKIVILLVFTILFASTELHEIIRLPKLLSHYLEHAVKNKNLSFSDFIFTHYNTQHKDDRTNQDDNLPFKPHKYCINISETLRPTFNQIKINRLTFFIKKIYPILSDINFSSADLASIWQPPKLS
jgi:hypothetical protein